MELPGGPGTGNRRALALCLSLCSPGARAGCTPGGVHLGATPFSCVSDDPALASLGVRFLYTAEREASSRQPGTQEYTLRIAVVVPAQGWLALGWPQTPGKSECPAMQRLAALATRN